MKFLKNISTIDAELGLEPNYILKSLPSQAKCGQKTKIRSRWTILRKRGVVLTHENLLPARENR
jgi:hypothetical protein